MGAKAQLWFLKRGGRSMNRKTKALLILGITLCLCSLFFILPVSNTIDEIDNLAPMAVILHTGDIQVDETATEDAWKLVTYVENYDMQENEAPEIKEKVLQVVRNIKCYRTPKTIFYNISGKTPMLYGENKNVIMILHSKEETQMLYIKGKYIIQDGNYYSLGYHGAEKGEKYIEEIQTIMKDAEEYLQETTE